MKYILAMMIGFFSLNASAALYLDPYLSYALSGGYERGTTDEDASGIFLGLRGGYSMLGLAFGLEYMMSDGEIDTNPTADTSHASMGVFVAYELPILLRFYGTYFFADAMDAETTSTTEFEGTGLKLGVGYTGLPFVSINFEYYTATYDENQNGSINPDADYNTMMLGVSMPLSL